MNKQIILVAIVVLISDIGIFLLFPLIEPLFLSSETGLQQGENTENIKIALLGLTLALYPLGCFIFSPLFGSLSDCHGRKPYILLNLLLQAFCYAAMGAAIAWHNIYGFMFAYFLAGCFSCNYSLSLAIACDDKGNKIRSLGIVSGASCIACTLGILLAGMLTNNTLVSWFNLSTPFYATAIISFIALFIAALFLKETVTKKTAYSGTTADTLNLLKKSKQLYASNKTLYSLLIVNLGLLIGVQLIYKFISLYYSSNWAASPSEISYYLAIFFTSMSITEIFIVTKVSHRYSTATSMLISSFCLSMTILLLLVVSNTVQLHIITISLGALIALSTTLIVSDISDSSHRDRQGETLGINSSYRQIANMLSSLAGAALGIVSINLVILAASLFIAAATFAYYSIHHSHGKREANETF
ncbi:putative MFS family arabinose efflux permease [Sinobacterium caligoides]|uniref:Putative MFS family arabinose efflux permease n=1 Tax=Sinobacterium caligoides TaxID=933926 RepID=A0A3N2DDQ6_9GAMM|nr:MFS transporter [Sinobacterium caligoides]ROR97906.1 putative MFS family arabinose efflux permease [Sinobacterium caligoides]